jgi:ABC-2 type transport system ATP-binding protein
MTTLLCRHLGKKYGRTTVLRNVDLTLRPGTSTGLVGPNGSGKSTLMRLIAGLTRPTFGDIAITRAPDTGFGSSDNSVGAFLGVQNMHPGRTVRETVKLSSFLLGLPSSRAYERLEWCGLASVGSRRVGSLSLGMKVRLGLALATLRRPQILLLDEPMNGLDVDGIQWIKSVVLKQKETGGTVLLSSHLLRELEVVVDRVVVLDKGAMVRDIATEELGGSKSSTLLRIEPNRLFTEKLAEKGWHHRQTPAGYIIDAVQLDVAVVAHDSGALIHELRPATGASLEDFFVASAHGSFAPPIIESEVSP